MAEKYVGLKSCPSCKELQNSIREECTNCGHDFTKVLTVSDNKQRHGCLTAWLIFMSIGNSISALIYLIDPGMVQVDASEGTFLLLAFLGAFNVMCAIALLQWKRWGFYGFCGTAVISCFINVSLGLGIVSVIFALIAVGALFGMLNIGQERKAWPKLE